MHVIEKFEIIQNKKGKYGLKDNINNKFVLEPIYDIIHEWQHSKSYYICSGEYDKPDIPDLYVIVKDNKVGFANTEGIVVKPTYDGLGVEDFTFSQKLYPAFMAEKDGKLGYIDKWGKPLSKFKYQDVEFPLVAPLAHVLNVNGTEEFISLKSGKTFYSNVKNYKITYTTSQRHLSMLINNNRYKIFDIDGNCVADFLNNEKLNSAKVCYLNEKLLIYFVETDTVLSGIKMGLMNYNGKILTDLKYADIDAIEGTSIVLCRNLIGGLYELVNACGNVLQSGMCNAGNLEGYNMEGMLVKPIHYWKEGDDPTDIDLRLLVDESIIAGNAYQD